VPHAKLGLVDPSLFPDESLIPHVTEFDEEFTLEFREKGCDVVRFIRFRILTRHEKVGDVQALTSVRFEILDDADAYDIVEAAFGEREFRRLKESNALLVDFKEFPGAVQTLLKDSEKSGTEITVKFWKEGGGTGTLEFSQLLELKAIGILNITFTRASPEFISKQVQYRYEKLAFELKRKKLMLAKLKQEMQSRNPILYRAIDPHQKTSPRK
jgi:hypothetical protein